MVDIWAYYNNADEAELYLNGVSQGISTKTSDRFHAFWRIKFLSGTIRAVTRKNGKLVLEKEISTAGNPDKILLEPDRRVLNADGKDLSFITVRVTDKAGNFVPYADNLIKFNIAGNGIIAGVDNGCQTSMEPFKANQRKLFNGMCLLIVKSTKKAGSIMITASSEGLSDKKTVLETKKIKTQ